MSGRKKTTGTTSVRQLARPTRRQQLEQRRAERLRTEQLQARARRIRLASLLGAGVVVLSLVVFFVVRMTLGSSAATSAPHPGNGQDVDQIACQSMEGAVIHLHAYLEIYVDGKPVEVPPGVGIVAPPGTGVSALASNGLTSCLYSLHVHDGQPNIIHVESPSQQTYTIGEFFDIWGQPLSRTQVLGHQVDAAHPLVVNLFDGAGHQTAYTGDPRQISLAAHETIVLRFNSSQITPTPFTAWNGL